MQFLSLYGLFLAKTITLIIGIFIIVVGIFAIAAKNKHAETGRLKIKNLNDKFEDLRTELAEELLDKAELKAEQKQKKLTKKQQKDNKEEKAKRTVFVLDFNGDVRAQAVASLREEITALLTIAKPQDEVVVCLESPGGLVHAYGLAASQLQRIRDHGLKLTVCVDKVAASGGYMMACVADTILAAPFAIIGSIGVVAQIPNFNRVLKEKHIDFEQLTAGEYKRTLSIFGENTPKAREKFQEQIEETHQLFKQFVKMHRRQVDIDQVATGEYWYATKAKEFHLIDDLMTSDDFLLKLHQDATVLKLSYKPKRSLSHKLLGTAKLVRQEIQDGFKQATETERFL